MARIDELVAYPLKSFDGVTVDRGEIGPAGALRGDRSYAFVRDGVDPYAASVGGGGGYVNGKSEPSIHRIRASYEVAGDADATPIAVTLSRPASERAPAEERTFSLPDDREGIAAWLGAYLGYPVDLVREPAGGFPDDRVAPGPTIVSTATLRTVASWYDDIADATEVRRRLRPNLIVGGVPAFWEDRLFADEDFHVRFTVDDVEIHGVNPCQRCVVPSRHPDTGMELPNFRETFIRNRRRTMPDWTESDRFDHDFRLMVNTAVPKSSWGNVLAVDDPVRIGDIVPVPEPSNQS